MRRKMITLAAITAVGSLGVTGCGFGGLNSVVLPGAVGTGDSGYTISVEFANVQNLVANSEVKVNDQTVGTVEKIGLQGWHANTTLSLRNDVRLPANAVATIGQKSLLGAEYVQLAAPSTEAPTGELRPGGVIPLAHSGNFPETEDVLAALSMWLNGGGLQQVQTITTEVNTALAGNEKTARSLLANLGTFVATLDAQRGQLTKAIDSIDRLSGTLSTQREQLGTAIDRFGPGLKVLNQQRGSLVNTLGSLNRLGVVGTQVINESQGALLTNLHQLQPTLGKLVEAGSAIPQSLDLLGTFLFPVKTVPYVVKSDYLNSTFTVDVSLPALASGLLPGTPLSQALPALRTALQATNPLTGPLSKAVGGASSSTVVNGQNGGEVNLPPPGALPKPPPRQYPEPAPSPSSNGDSCGLLGELLGGC